ncbi:MAG TPA: DUF2891 domain-containing protein [Rhizomicrobium sp.]|jgi:hypothetical protein|nr:DUF2891 domain-containing protein [Rhizomicrobium sp.]
MSHALTLELASHFARTALSHVTREYPNKLDHVLSGPEDVKSPRELHPIFYGSFDWHSCVHGYWTLARCLRRFPDLPEAAAIRALYDAQFTPDKVAGEVAYLGRPSARGFERPYGWAWALKLQSELLLHCNADGKRWSHTLQPFADAFVQRLRDFLPVAIYPTRAGTHGNSAFATVLALDYARVSSNARLQSLLVDKVQAWYSDDAAYNGFEPSQDDFLSPSLMEAACMSRVHEESVFSSWFERFLPHAKDGQPAYLFTPAAVSDRSDGKIAHLDGLNLSRAWCWRLISSRLRERKLPDVSDAIERHLESALPNVTGDYMGEHWLASFALLALDPYPD